MTLRNFSQTFSKQQLVLGLVGSALLTFATQAIVYYKLWQFMVCSFNTPPESNACTLDFYKDIYFSPGGWLLMLAQIGAVASLVFFLDGYSKRKK